MKMIFNYDANKTHFRNKGFALSLALKVRFFPRKGDHYCIQTQYKDLFSYYNLILRKLSEKMSRKALENTNEKKKVY